MKRDSIVWGVLLILLGLGFLAYQWFPGLFAGFQWPWILVLIGGVFTVASLVTRTGGLLIPGLILMGLGGIFLYQNRTGNWDSWAYVWALIPGFIGLGMFLGSLYDRDMRPARPAGLVMMVVSLVLFAVFGGFFGLQTDVLRFWPILLIILGAVVFIRGLRPRD